MPRSGPIFERVGFLPYYVGGGPANRIYSAFVTWSKGHRLSRILYKIKIYKKGDKRDWTDYSLEVPEIDLTEPLAKMTTYIYNSIKKNKNQLFDKDFNEKVTFLLERINKNNV